MNARSTVHGVFVDQDFALTYLVVIDASNNVVKAMNWSISDARVSRFLKNSNFSTTKIRDEISGTAKTYASFVIEIFFHVVLLYD